MAVVGAVAAGCGPTAEVVTTISPAASLPTAATPGAQTSGPASSVRPTASPPGSAAASPEATGQRPNLDVWEQLVDFPTNDAFEVTSVTGTASGYVAVGFKAMPGEDYDGRRQGVVWRSSDGHNWQPIEEPALELVTPEDVVALGDDAFIFGTVEPGDGWGVWRSSAGGPWERQPVPASMEGGTVNGAEVAGGRIVAFGWSGHEAESAIVWSSIDAALWTESTDLLGMTDVTAIGAGPGSIVAFGNRETDELSALELVAATSLDASAFGPASVPPLAATTISSVVSGDAGLVAVGEGVDEFLGFSGVALHSADGVTWAQARGDPTFGGAALSAAHALSGGYVAVGTIADEADFLVTGGSWLSADGLDWRFLGPIPGPLSDVRASALGPFGIVAFTISQELDDEGAPGTIAAWLAPFDTLTSAF